MVEIPDSLVERLKARQAVLVAGLGCSELAGAPGWRELAEVLAAGWCSPMPERWSEALDVGTDGDAVAFMRDHLPPAWSRR